jgi:two-component system, OmpR family, response regulator MprA
VQHQGSSDPGDILVVDDDPMIVEMLTDFLAFEGYKVRGASNGLEALAMIMGRRPVLVLLDLHMPEMTGAELIQALSRTAFVDLPIIIITASPIDAQRIARMRTMACLTKPIDLDVLLAGIAKVMRATH